jgi:LuxR family transcriptional regulator, quorum-sensing system regulator BjaR1
MCVDPVLPETAFEFVDRISTITAIDEILGTLTATLSAVGYKHVMIADIAAPRMAPNPIALSHSWPEGWFDRYRARRYFEIDPIGQFVTKTSRPFTWEEVPAPFFATRAAASIMGEAREFGLVDGLCMPLYSFLGRLSVVAVASDAFIDLAPRDRGATHLMVAAAHARVSAIVEANTPFIRPRLTPREREVLTWSAAGKSQWEVSRILGVAERTVIGHLENVRTKLDASNTTQAVAVALMSGELAAV